MVHSHRTKANAKAKKDQGKEVKEKFKHQRKFSLDVNGPEFRNFA